MYGISLNFELIATFIIKNVLLCLSNPESLPAQDTYQPKVPVSSRSQSAQEPSQPKISVSSRSKSALNYYNQNFWIRTFNENKSMLLHSTWYSELTGTLGWLGSWADWDLGLTGILCWLGSWADRYLGLVRILGCSSTIPLLHFVKCDPLPSWTFFFSILDWFCYMHSKNGQKVNKKCSPGERFICTKVTS